MTIYEDKSSRECYLSEVTSIIVVASEYDQRVTLYRFLNVLFILDLYP